MKRKHEQQTSMGHPVGPALGQNPLPDDYPEPQHCHQRILSHDLCHEVFGHDREADLGKEIEERLPWRDTK